MSQIILHQRERLPPEIQKQADDWALQQQKVFARGGTPKGLVIQDKNGNLFRFHVTVNGVPVDEF